MDLDRARRARARARVRLARAQATLERALRERASAGDRAPEDVRALFEGALRRARLAVWAASAALDSAEAEVSRALWRQAWPGSEPP